MHALEWVQIGNAIGLILPKEAWAGWKRVNGDSLCLTEAPGGLALTPCAPTFEERLERGGQFMRAYKDALRAPAKMTGRG